MSDDDDPIDRRLAGHAVRADVDATAARRIRARAHEALAGRAPLEGWARWLEPALAFALGGVQLVWALRVVIDVYR